MADCDTGCVKSDCAEDDCTDAPNPKCQVQHEFNSNFIGIINNYWNRSCGCMDTAHFFYDFEIGHCVDVNECLYVNCSGSFSSPQSNSFFKPNIRERGLQTALILMVVINALARPTNTLIKT